jgi:hypothetical protein
MANKKPTLLHSEFRQLTPLNIVLFVLIALSLEYFVIAVGQVIFMDYPNPVGLGEIALMGLVLLIALESWMVFKLDSLKGKEHFLTPLLLTHLPWFLGLGLRLVTRMTFPDPHNFLFRKVEVLLGLMWVTHIFLFSGWLLWRVRWNGKPISYTYGIIAVYFFVGITAWTTQCDLSGDEPHYLLMAYNLIHHGNLDLAQAYQNREYTEFYHRGVLEPQGLDHVVDGRHYSFHPLGPVLLILPGFFLLGRLGAAVTMALLTALALYLSILVLELTGAKGKGLQAVAAVGLFSSPFLLFAGLIFPEIPTACLISLTLYLILKRRWFWLGLTLGVFLWMHNRNALLVIPILIFLAFEFWNDRNIRWNEIKFLAAGFAIPTVLLALYFHVLYGVWTPLGAHNEAFTSLFRLDHFWIGFFGLVLDQECGLWFYFAIFGMTLAGGLMLWSSKNPIRHLVVWTFLFYYIFMSFYENLGLTPGTRYMVSITPLMLFMLYAAFEKLKFSIWEILTLISFVGGVVINWVLAVVPWMRYNKLDGENMMLKILGGIVHLPLTRSQPSFQAAVISSHSYFISVFWFTVTVVLSVWFWRQNKDRKTDEDRPRHRL